ncbi:ABC transporter substrate-binding protein [Nocardioides immobilis]|nr:ABC transporter substrate-binding protein [Nocardioides immobilis]
MTEQSSPQQRAMMTFPPLRPRARGLAVAGVLLLGLTACGGGDDEPETTPTQDPDLTFTGEPVKVMTVTPYDTDTLNMRAALDVADGARVAINNAGGINGHELVVIACNEGADPNKAADCARQAVEEDVSAMVGGFTANGDTIMPILEEAGIPWIAPTGISAAELTSELSYPISSGVVGLASLGARTAEDGCDDVAFVTYDLPTTDQVAGLVDVGRASQGSEPTTQIKVPPTTTDYSSIAQEIADYDCAVMALPSNALVGMSAAGASLGSGTTYYVVPGGLTDSATDQAAGTLEGAVTLSSFPAATDGVWDDAKAAVGDLEGEENGGWSLMWYQNTWAGYQTFASLLEGKDDLSARGVAKVFGTAAGVETDFTAPIDFTQEFPAPGLNRMFNRQILFISVEDGALEPESGDFVDLAAALAPAP